MLDINFLKQDDQNRKVSLLKQVKTSLESLMFDRSSNASANFAHSFNGVITMFCRCILAVLEDGVILPEHNLVNNDTLSQVATTPMPFPFSSPSSLDSSPSASYSASATNQFLNSPSNSSSPNSRKTTINSMGNFGTSGGGGVGMMSQTNQAVWSFVLYVFHEYYLQNSNEADDEKRKQLENVAYKDFKTIYVEITASKSTNGISHNNHHHHTDNETSMTTNNFALEWISNSLRRRLLLNQLIYILSLDEILLRQYYKANSFVLDRSLVKDFLVYIRAFEEKNYDILNKVKCNFFSSTNKARASTDGFNILEETTNKLELPHHQTHHYHRKQKSMDFVVTNMMLQNREESQVDHYGGLDNVKLENSLSPHSLNNSLIELKINELNAMPKMRNSHRRMHSFPNIQVNILKKNSMMAANK
jgi:hypothetical protein